ARRLAMIVPPDLAADWVRSAGRDPGECKGACVGECAVPERGGDENRSSRFQSIECGAVRLHARRAHALLEPAHHLEPRIRIFGRRVVKAGLDTLLHFGDRKRLIVETALQELYPGLERMHVTVDEAGHKEPTF